jgi:hypothetical protein
MKSTTAKSFENPKGKVDPLWQRFPARPPKLNRILQAARHFIWTIKPPA